MFKIESYNSMSVSDLTKYLDTAISLIRISKLVYTYNIRFQTRGNYLYLETINAYRVLIQTKILWNGKPINCCVDALELYNTISSLKNDSVLLFNFTKTGLELTHSTGVCNINIKSTDNNFIVFNQFDNNVSTWVKVKPNLIETIPLKGISKRDIPYSYVRIDLNDKSYKISSTDKHILLTSRNSELEIYPNTIYIPGYVLQTVKLPYYLGHSSTSYFIKFNNIKIIGTLPNVKWMDLLVKQTGIYLFTGSVSALYDVTSKVSDAYIYLKNNNGWLSVNDITTTIPVKGKFNHKFITKYINLALKYIGLDKKVSAELCSSTAIKLISNDHLTYSYIAGVQ